MTRRDKKNHEKAQNSTRTWWISRQIPKPFKAVAALQPSHCGLAGHVYDGITSMYVSASHISHDLNIFCSIPQVRRSATRQDHVKINSSVTAQLWHLFSPKTEGRSTASGVSTFQREAQKLNTALRNQLTCWTMFWAKYLQTQIKQGRFWLPPPLLQCLTSWQGYTETTSNSEKQHM